MADEIQHWPFGGRAYELEMWRDGVLLRFPPDTRWYRGRTLADAEAAAFYAALSDTPKEA